MQLLISIAGILLTILFVIGTHEFAHFMMARRVGVKVLRFSIGFGKTLLRWHDKSGTEYVFALIPLGGYVRMLDENEEPVPEIEQPYAYNRQPFYKKFLIVLAGPAMNLLCALILYWVIFVTGFVTIKPIIGTITPNSIASMAGLKPQTEIISIDHKPTQTWTSVLFRLLAHAGNTDQINIETRDLRTQQSSLHLLNAKDWQLNGLTPDPFLSLGFKPYEPTIPLIIGVIKPDSPASLSALKIGDKLIAIDGTKVKDWEYIITTVMNHPDKTLTFKVERNRKTLLIPVNVGAQRSLLFKKTGYLGIAPQLKELPADMLHQIKYSPLAAIPYAWQEMWDLTYFNFLVFGKMITGKLSLQSLGGPITIFESAGTALNYGFLSFISFLAFLSVAIGVINLLPIPGLDGGHLALQIIEAVIRRPIPEKALIFMYKMGFLFLMMVFAIAFWNDIQRLF